MKIQLGLLLIGLAVFFQLAQVQAPAIIETNSTIKKVAVYVDDGNGPPGGCTYYCSG